MLLVGNGELMVGCRLSVVWKMGGLFFRGGSNTVKPLITDPPKSGQPLYSGRLTCPRLTLA